MTSDLESALYTAADDDPSWAVYADWLQARGDVRGELAAAQLAGHPSAAALLETHAEHLLPTKLATQLAYHESVRPGEDASEHAKHYWSENDLHIRWHAGFIRVARLARGDPEYPIPLPELVTDFFAHPSSRYVRELTVGPFGEYGEYEYDEVCRGLASADLRALRRFFMADYSHGHSELSWSELGDLGGIWSAAPGLEHIHVRGGIMTLGDLDLPEARSFVVETSGLSSDSIQSITCARWPKLTKLELWFGSEEYGSKGDVASIAPVLAAAGLDKVRDLGLMNAEFSDEIATALIESPIAAQLERLDLSLGVMTAAGAGALVAGKAKLENLAALNVDGNHIDDDGCAALRVAFPFVEIGDQGDMDFRYVKVGE